MNQNFTLPQFNRLSNCEKYSALEERGVYLKAFYLYKAFKIALFSLCNFYVEVWLNQATDELKKAIAFDAYERLDPFLPSVDVSRLYALLKGPM